MKTMKNTITAILLCITTLTLAQEEVNVTIAGKITNLNSDTLIVKTVWGDNYHTIPLDKDGSFKSTFDIETGYYRLNDLKESTTVYLGKD
jgi:hypothetical protein